MDSTRTPDPLVAAIFDRPADAGILIRLAQRQIAHRDWDGAERTLLRAFAVAPMHPLILSHLSAAYVGRGDGETARGLTRSVMASLMPEVEPGPEGAPSVLVLRATADQPFKPGPAGSATLPVSMNLHSFVDRSRFRVVDAFAETLVGRPEAWDALGRVDVVLNLSVDPGVNGRQFPMIRSIVDRLGVPVVNPPERCTGLDRDENYRRLHDIAGLIYPRTARATAETLTADRLRDRGFEFPMILRNTSDHFGSGAVLAAGPDDLETFRVAVQTSEAYVIQYVENRVERPGAEPVWRRFRLAFFEGRPVPVNLHFDTGWNAHGRQRDLLMPLGSPAFEEERAFIEDWRSAVGPVAEAALLEIARRTPLDYLGIDFTLLPDGRALVFEVNPAMALLIEHARTAPHIELSIGRYRDEMTRLLSRRMAEAPAAQA